MSYIAVISLVILGIVYFLAIPYDTKVELYNKFFGKK